MPGLAIGFAPWALFLVMPHPMSSGALAYVSATTTLVTIVLLVRPGARPRAQLLEVAAVPTFAGLTLLALVGDESLQNWLRSYSSAVALWVLAAVMAASMRTVPFTERYARRSLPDSYWNSPHLHEINRRISLVWAVCTTAAAVSVSVAPSVAHGRAGDTAQYVSLSLAWVVPLVLVMAAYRYTERTVDPTAA